MNAAQTVRPISFFDMPSFSEKGHSAGGVQAGELTLDKFFKIIRRYSLLILLMSGICAGLAAFVISVLPPRYEAEALLLIDNDIRSGFELRSVAGVLRVDNARIATEIETMKSPAFLAQVAARLDGAPISAEGGGNIFDPGKTLALEDVQKTANLARKITIEQVPGSPIVRVAARASTSSRAIEIAETLIDTYRIERTRLRQNDSDKIIASARARLAELDQSIADLETRIVNYRAENNLVEGASVEMTAERIKQIAAMILAAQSKLTETGARLEQTRIWLKEGGNSETLSSFLTSPLVMELHKKIQAAELQRAQLSGRYGPKHPLMIANSREITDLKAQVRDEVRQHTTVLESDIKSLEQQIAVFENELRLSKDMLGRQNSDQLPLRTLQRDLEAYQTLYKTLAQGLKDTLQTNVMTETAFRIISPVNINMSDTGGNRFLFPILAGIMGLFVGVMIAITRDRSDARVDGRERIEERLGIPCAALIPSAKDHRKKTAMADRILDPGQTILAEAVRVLRVGLKHYGSPPHGRKGRIIAVTSSITGEDKSAIAAWIALQAAKAGEKVLLIDGDLRNPVIETLINVPHVHTLQSYLTGEARLEDVIVKEPRTGLHLMYANASVDNVPDMLSSAKMKAFIDSVAQVYDLVLIDTPPALSAIDTRIAAAFSDCVLYVAAWKKTTFSTMEKGIKSIRDYGQTRIIAALSGVDTK